MARSTKWLERHLTAAAATVGRLTSYKSPCHRRRAASHRQPSTAFRRRRLRRYRTMAVTLAVGHRVRRDLGSREMAEDQSPSAIRCRWLSAETRSYGLARSATKCFATATAPDTSGPVHFFVLVTRYSSTSTGRIM